MVSIVIVSHSKKLAEATVEMAEAMASNVKIIPAGGTDSGEFGTSEAKISKAIDEAYTEDGVVVIADLGSSFMASEAVIAKKTEKGKLVRLADCPIVEGAIAACVSASCALSIEEVLRQAHDAQTTSKM